MHGHGFLNIWKILLTRGDTACLGELMLRRWCGSSFHSLALISTRFIPHFYCGCIYTRGSYRHVAPVVFEHRLTHLSMAHTLEVLGRETRSYRILQDICEQRVVSSEWPRHCWVLIVQASCGAWSSKCSHLLNTRISTNRFPTLQSLFNESLSFI